MQVPTEGHGALALTGFLGQVFEPTAIVGPPCLIARCHVVVAVAQPDRPVDELTDDIGVSSVPMGLSDHMYQDPVQRHLTPIVWPPRHVARSHRDPSSTLATCLINPNRLVPVGVRGRRMSYSESPSSFHSRASRAACRYPATNRPCRSGWLFGCEVAGESEEPGGGDLV